MKYWLLGKTLHFLFEHHQLVNRPENVVTATLIAGRVAWRDGAYVPEFGRERYGRVLRHREHEAELAVTA